MTTVPSSAQGRSISCVYGEADERLLSILERIAVALERLAEPDPTQPRHVKPLSEYAEFDWDTIGATIIKRDRYGAAVVEQGGKLYYRRSKSDFGEDIWYSHGLGVDEQGRKRYATLIKFIQPPRVKSLSQDLVDACGSF